jgi:hypothetical protein
MVRAQVGAPGFDFDFNSMPNSRYPEHGMEQHGTRLSLADYRQ